MEQTTKKVEKQKETVKEKKVYTQEEAYSSSLNYFKGDELAARVWVSKYALKDSYGNIFELNPDDGVMRVDCTIDGYRLDRSGKRV